MAGGLWVLKANCLPLLTVAVVCCGAMVEVGVEVSTLPPAQNVVKDGVRMLIPVTRAGAVCNLFQRIHHEGRECSQKEKTNKQPVSSRKNEQCSRYTQLHKLRRYLSGCHLFATSSALTLPFPVWGKKTVTMDLPCRGIYVPYVAAIRPVKLSSCTGKWNTETGGVNDIYHVYLSH